MGHQKQNGRNAGSRDENRPSWRPRDQVAHEGDRSVGDRDDRRRSSADPRPSRWSDDRDDRDDRDRSSDGYGQGQSGYAAGRQADDPSIGMLGRNQSYPRSHDDRPFGLDVDDRFEGRGGQGYWQDRGTLRADRSSGRERSSGRDERAWGHGREDRGFGGAEHRGYTSGYEDGGAGGSHGAQRGQRGGQQGFGGHGVADEHAGRPGAQEPGAWGYGQGRSGGYGAEHGSQGARGEPVPGGQRGKGPLGYQRSDDRIRELACEVLTDDDLVDARAIEVAVTRGEVTLTGTVPDRRTKRLAEAVVERCPGVTDVQNQLRVSEAEPRRPG